MYDQRLSLAKETQDFSIRDFAHAKCRFSADVHDLSNSIQAIAFTLMALRARLPQEATGGLDTLMKAALRSTQRACEQSQRLTKLLHAPQCVLEVIDVHSFLRTTQPILRNLVGANIDLKFTLSPEIIEVYCDPMELESAVLNLVINAKQAMPAGGRILIETSTSQSDDLMCLKVADDGCGMSPSCAENACNAFFTTKQHANGTGLGLWSVKDFTERMGGRLRIHSIEGAGTSVQLQLPRHNVDDGELNRRAAEGSSRARG